ncbi:MAG: DnaJ domain-containing protein [Chloroflexota bacterium]
MHPDPYAILGVTPDATPATIRKAYHDRARSTHPDLIGDAGLATMRNLNLAWDALRDPVRRAAYDTSRMLAGQAGLSQPRQPEWTGAAGRPPGRPSGSRLDFGLYSGWTLGEIARHDNGYLMWLADRPEGKPFADEIKTVLEAMRPAAPDFSRDKPNWRR